MKKMICHSFSLPIIPESYSFSVARAALQMARAGVSAEK